MGKPIKLDSSWLEVLKEEFEKDYFQNLKNFLQEEKQSSQIVYPPGSLIFAALDNTPFDKVKIVILGQDPYHGPGQANGLSFSVSQGIKPPPSLKNIYKELESDIDFKPVAHGDLSAWSANGVLLLNSVLTVKAGLPASHQNKGWETFTDVIISKLSSQKSNLVFFLWGNFARGKKGLIDAEKHLILEAAHPSPFSAYNGFFGCKHFSKANQYLEQHHLGAVDWELKKS
jgi:uracil-DNA glycosylase